LDPAFNTGWDARRAPLDDGRSRRGVLRRAARELLFGRSDDREAHVNRNPTTEELVQLLIPLWSDTLSTPATAESDFLMLGGSSLGAISIAALVAERYPDCEGLDLVATQATFERPTLRAVADELAACIRDRRARDARPAAI
jgi:hypothetical protein